MEDIKVESIVEEKIEEPILSEPIVEFKQADIVAKVVPSEWAGLDNTQKKSMVAALIDDNLDALVETKSKTDKFQKIISDEITAYKELEAEYQGKRRALEQKFKEEKEKI
jgi:hypothetical protein